MQQGEVMILDGEDGRLHLPVEVGRDEPVHCGPIAEDLVGLVSRVWVRIIVGDEIGGLDTGIHRDLWESGAL